MKTIVIRITLFFVLAFLTPGSVRAQDFLHKNKEEIQRFLLREHTESGATYQEKGDTLVLHCQEQDDIGRFFDITYTFALRKGNCVNYEKKLPVHSFWITHLLDQVEMQGGSGEGQAYPVEGYSLFPLYLFENYRLYTRVDKEFLYYTFRPLNE